MSISVLLQQMGMIFILAGIGFALQKKNVIDEITSKKLATIVVDICNPALIMASILSGGITATKKDLLVAIILGIIFYAVLVLLGFILPYILRSDPENRRFYNLMTVYTNTGFLGIPIAKAILPENAMLYIIVINVVYSLMFYTHGYLIMNSGKGSKLTKRSDTRSGSQAVLNTTEPLSGSADRKPAPKKHPLLNMLNPGTVMAVLTLIVFCFDINLPLIMSSTLIYIGNATVFLSMVILGVSIARSRLSDAVRNTRLWGYIVLRMLLFPVIIVLIMRALSFDNTVTLAMCLMGAVPVGSLPLITAEKNGEDTSILSAGVALTTTVSLFTITLLMAVFGTA